MWLFYQILQVDFIPVLSIAYLLILMKSNDAYEHDLNHFFFSSLYLLFALLIFDNFDYFYSNQNHPHLLHRFVLLTGYTLRVALLMCAIRVMRRERLTETGRRLLFIPAIINGVLMLSGLFFNHIVWVDAQNVVHHELLSYVPHAMSCIYYVVAVVLSVRCLLAGRTVEGVILLMSFVAVFMAVAGEMVMDTRGILISVISLMLSFYYLYLHLENFKRDNLTGMLNRTTFFADIRGPRSEKIIGLGEFDLNDLKKINDLQGHDEGDKAIITVANTIRNNLPPSCRLYRMGGDEFVALFYSVSWDEANAITETIKKAFQETDYRCAVGIAPWDGANAFKEAYKLADRRMYEDKEHQKAMLIDALR